MSKKPVVKEQRFSANQYFEDDKGYCPFKDVKLVPKKEQPVKQNYKPKQLDPKIYDMFGPSLTSIVRKTEDMPEDLLLECSPQASLDLHGVRPSKNNIAEMVQEFLSESIEKGRKKVEIIVGKGLHSNQEPVLPAIVKAALTSSLVVKRYDFAPANRGGEGSYWIILGERKKGEAVIFSTGETKEEDIKGLEIARAKAKAKAQAMVKNIHIDYDSYLPKKNEKF